LQFLIGYSIVYCKFSEENIIEETLVLCYWQDRNICLIWDEQCSGYYIIAKKWHGLSMTINVHR
jgi:hypothetical protein